MEYRHRRHCSHDTTSLLVRVVYSITIPVKESFITRLPIPIFGPFKTLLLDLEIFLVEFKMSPAEFEIIVATHMRSVAEFEISRGADSRSNGKVADIM